MFCMYLYRLPQGSLVIPVLCHNRMRTRLRYVAIGRKGEGFALDQLRRTDREWYFAEYGCPTNSLGGRFSTSEPPSPIGIDAIWCGVLFSTPDEYIGFLCLDTDKTIVEF